ncbi:MAG TPA: helix-turn-helix domain-containing protein [Acidimicrobiales bacterium]|nr:helix-turn-helix domain-containing protein [Acidimicrobiales bacterium]
MTERVKASNEKRPNRREVAAAETRREILRAARRIFAEHGYANTSVHQIADEAGVALQTVYTSVGSKATLVLALNDLIDDEAGVSQLAAELLEETDPSQLINKAVHLTRQLNERCGDIVGVMLSAEPAEPDAAAAVADGMRRHQHGASVVAERLANLGALQTDVTEERAAAALSLMTSPASWRQLTQGAGWTYDETEAWLARSLAQLLLKPKTKRTLSPR